MRKLSRQYPKSFRDTRLPTCQTPGMDEDQQLLNQLMLGMARETRHRMQRFIRLVAERDECALTIIRQIETGRVCLFLCPRSGEAGGKCTT